MAYTKEAKALYAEDYSKIEEKRKRKLTLKQRRFIKNYLETGNAVESVMRSYGVRNRSNAANMADALMKTLDFTLILEIAGVSDSELAIKMTDGLNATKVNKRGEKIPDLELRHKYLVTALEAKKKIKQKLEVTGQNGEPIRFNILAGHGFIPAVPRSEPTNATPTAGTTGGPAEVQGDMLAQTSPKNNNSNN